MAVAVGLFAWLVSQRNTGEASYQGRTVSDWVYSVSDVSMIEVDQQFQKMMDALGTNAIPPLLAILQKDDGNLAPLFTRISGMPSAPESVKAYAFRQTRKRLFPKLVVAYVLPMAGTNATFAIPALKQLAADTNNQMRTYLAYQTLANIEQPASYKWFRQTAPSFLLPPATGAWLQQLQHGATAGREKAAVELVNSGYRSYEPIPILDMMCSSPDSAKRKAAINALAKLVPFHAAARDAVKRAAENEDEAIRLKARRILSDFYAANSSKAARPKKSE